MGLFATLHAKLRGEIAAGDLQAFRRAGASVYDLVAEIDRQSLDGRLSGQTVWTRSPAQQFEALCAWCALVLQVTADAYLEVHDAHGPVGFAREQTHDQVLAFYHGVEEWVRRGREAEYAPADHHIDVALPADVPGPVGAWRQPFPLVHVLGMRRALETVRPRAQAAGREFTSLPGAEQHPEEVRRAQQLLARATTSADYAEQMAAAGVRDQLQGDAGRQLLAALNDSFHLGQLVAMPSLLAGYVMGDGPAR